MGDGIHKLEFFMSWTNFSIDLILNSTLNITTQKHVFDTLICQHKIQMRVNTKLLHMNM
jgi:hypothetical protein